MAIQSFSDRTTAIFFETGKLRKKTPWQGVSKVVQRKLDMIDYATTISDLKAPPGNQLEALKRDMIGFYSIRINDQWRIVFRWTTLGPKDVRIMDYHK